MGVYIPYTRLPSEYQEVEYIQSSGTQYIDTGYTPKTTSEFEVKFQNVSAINTYRTILGTRQDSGNNSFWIGWQNGKSYSQFSPTNSEVSSSSGWFNIGVDYTLEFKNKNLVNNGTTVVSSINFTQNAIYTLYLFSGHAYNKTNPFEPSASKIYYCKLREGGTLVRNLIPCYRKADDVIGMYDLVNNQFYTNSGSGTFSKGNDVTMVGLKNAYIGEVYEFSYDFRNKSVAIMEADGWNIFWNSSYATFNTNGLNTRNKNYSVMAKIENLNGKVSNSNKITLSMIGSITNTFGGRISLYNVATSATRSGVTGPFASNGSTQIQTSIYGTNYTDSRSVNTVLTVTTVLDFTAKTWKTTATDGYSRSGTLSDTEISNIKNNSNGFYISVGITGSNTSGGLTSIYVKIE